MRNVINSIANFDRDRRLRIKAIAGITRPCVPRECCTGKGTGYAEFEQNPPCIYAPRGFAADSFIYATTR